MAALTAATRALAASDGLGKGTSGLAVAAKIENQKGGAGLDVPSSQRPAQTPGRPAGRACLISLHCASNQYGNTQLHWIMVYRFSVRHSTWSGNVRLQPAHSTNNLLSLRYCGGPRSCPKTQVHSSTYMKTSSGIILGLSQHIKLKLEFLWGCN